MNRRPGYASVFPYYLVRDAAAFLEFLVKGLGGEVLERQDSLDGTVSHAAVKLGDHTIMVSEATADWPPMPGSYYYYVEDADAVLATALTAGGELVMPIEDKDYGDRQAGVRDPFGNLWWISQWMREGEH